MNGRKKQHGFSLIELMIALVIGLILVAGVLQIYTNNRQGNRIQSALGLIQEKGRYSVDLIAKDIRRAGYLGGNGDTLMIAQTQNPDTATTECSVTDDSWARQIGQSMFGVDDSESGYSCISAAEKTVGDILVVRYASEREATTFIDDRLYLRTALFGGEILKGSEIGTSTVVDQPQSTRELVARAYFVGPSNRLCADGSAQTALHWKRIGNNGRPESEELITGVDHFQVRYGIDGNGDGSANQYIDANQINASASHRWEQVVAARFWLLVGSGCEDPGFLDTKTYSLGNQTYTPNDSIRRQLFSTTVSLRN